MTFSQVFTPIILAWIEFFTNWAKLAIMLILVSEACIPVGCVPPACWLYPSMHCAEAVSARRGVFPEGVCFWASEQRRCLPRGVCLGGVCPGVCVADTPCEQNDWQTGVKTLPCRNFVAGGNKVLPRVRIEPGTCEVQCSLFWANLAFACETETSGSLSHLFYALFIHWRPKTRWCMNRLSKIS